MARMLGRHVREPLFCFYGWKCACERGRVNGHRRSSGRNVDLSRRIRRRREAREWSREVAEEMNPDYEGEYLFFRHRADAGLPSLGGASLIL
ncbi:Uncharacterised protein [Mycobacteroides abscessus subsp. bolletii]|nr:hypothetical protein SEA_BAUDELAIRE_2 [Mycobacterium phage Baudelaire]WKW86494.1 hypothetical protein SEA_AEGEUS_2 [Mycobacterium phage Aegeus]SKT45413.1 Uncharacterised protein [Mycobacteroides abscessus subsp. bolletii]